MKLSFENKESFMEAAETLRFNNDSDRNIFQWMGSSRSMSPQDFEWNEDIL